VQILVRAIAGAAVSLAIVVRMAIASATASSLCIVPVPLTDPAGLQAHLIASKGFPGSPWPVFYETGAWLAWMLDEAGQLARPKEFPTTNLAGDFVAEPAGRVIGTKRYGRQVYIQDPANGRFIGLDGTEKEAIGVVSMASWITDRRATIVATSTGLYALSDDATRPALNRIELAEAVPIGRVTGIFDLPNNHAAALTTADGRVFVLDAGNRLHEVSGVQIGKHDWFLGVRETEHPDRLLIQGSRQAWTAPMRSHGDGPPLPDQAREITTMRPDGSGVLRYYPPVGQYLVYGTPDRWFDFLGRAMFRLDDDLVAVEGSRGLSDYPFIREVPSRGIVVVETFGRLYRYDGKGSLEPIAGSLETEIGRFPRVHDLTSQGKVIVITASGLYELTLEGKLVRLPPPRELEGAKFFELAEMPAARLAVVFTNRGIFQIDAAGGFSRVTGDAHIDLGMTGPNLVLPIPTRDTLFFSTYGKGGQFMIMDRGSERQSACVGTQ
jgi:hypothetical protein